MVRVLNLAIVMLFLSQFSFAQVAESLEKLPEIPTETPVDLEPLKTLSDWIGSRKWRAPDFLGQSSSLGYMESEFQIPELLKNRVEFWKDIYTKYTTHEGVLHDTDDVAIVFSSISFKALEEQSDIGPRQLRKKKEKLVESQKDEIVEKIMAAMKNTETEGLSAEEKIFWSYARDLKSELGMNKRKLKKRIRFQLGQKDRFEQAIFLSGRYLEKFEKIFRDQGLPIELTRIVFVESSFNILAKSKVGASGLWQIMPSTAKPYRMIKDHIDYRNDPYEATKMAARILRMGFDTLGNWPLAITGYNHGPAGMKKLTQKYKTQDLASLIENATSRRSFGFASKNFYSSFLAALSVERESNLHFKNPTWSKELPVIPVRLARPLNQKELMDIFDQNKEMLELANPHISFAHKSKMKPIPEKTLIYLPESKKAEVDKAQLEREPASTPND